MQHYTKEPFLLSISSLTMFQDSSIVSDSQREYYIDSLMMCENSKLLIDLDSSVDIMLYRAEF